MQFGVGLLGKGYTIEGATERLLASDAGPHVKFQIHAGRYAAKIAKETVLSERATIPDLTDEGIVRRCAGCARPVRLSEAGMVRDTFLSEYSDYLRIAA